MSGFYIFPENTVVNKIIKKNKIYKKAALNNKVNKLLTREVDKIIWAHKLSTETTNLQAVIGVYEIQVFNIFLKTAKISDAILQAIDQSIVHPIIFQLRFENKTCFMATYKRLSKSDKSKWVIGDYFKTSWEHDNITKKKLPIVLNLGRLYEELLKGIIQIPSRAGESIGELVSRAEQIELKMREMGKLESRIKKEKQFNRKVDLNNTLNGVKREIKTLKRN
jgi:hypothetical protein